MDHPGLHSILGFLRPEGIKALLIDRWGSGRKKQELADERLPREWREEGERRAREREERGKR